MMEQKKEWQQVPVRLEAFDVVRRTVLASLGNTPLTRRALLACDEWINNVVAYSGAGSLYYFFVVDEDVLHMGFLDDGIPFDPTGVSVEVSVPFEELDRGGMGLGIIRRKASLMNYERRDGHNELLLEFRKGKTEDGQGRG